MKTVTEIFTSKYKIKGSEFFGYLLPCRSVDEADEELQTTKSRHPSATHHCYAYHINPGRPARFSSDDGEPKGTAGAPILNAMIAADLVNVLIVIVRYFGGTKLGKPGLSDAYGHTARLAIREAKQKQILPVHTYKIVYPYPCQGFIDQLKNDFGWFELNATYLETVELDCACPAPKAHRFEERLRSHEHLFEHLERTGKTYHTLDEV